VMGFEKAADARRMLVDLKDRLTKFGLALHEDKTRLIEFGRLPALRRQQRGERHPETFAFLEVPISRWSLEHAGITRQVGSGVLLAALWILAFHFSGRRPAA
jgi:hypothetical protein